MSNKVLVVVDMQNDFITGALANTEGQKIVPKLVDYVKNFDGDVFTTQDTHGQDYMSTVEGQNLPVPHCIMAEDGWQLIPELLDILQDDDFYKNKSVRNFLKNTFGSIELAEAISSNGYDEIEICGVCTDICVISNTLLIKAALPNAKISVLKDLCAGVTPESHETALKAMAACHINIV